MILGGESAKPGELPSLVVVAYLVPNGKEEAIVCSGTVVAPRFVLTAAHCVEPPHVRVDVENFRVFTGDVNLRGPDRKIRDVVRAMGYPRYNPLGDRGDAGLLELADPAGVPSMPLASRRFWSNGSEAEIAGWGDVHLGQPSPTYLLHRARTAILSFRECREQGGGPGQICAEDTALHRTSACDGDSGGPLLTRRPRDRRLVEIGIVHGGFNCDPRRTTFFTSTVPVFDWVRARIAEARRSAQDAARAATRQPVPRHARRAPRSLRPTAAP